MSFGERLRLARKAMGLTQEQLAVQIGVAKSTLTGYEKGNREPDVEKIKALANALGISGDELLGTDFTSSKAPEIPKPPSPLTQRINRDNELKNKMPPDVSEGDLDMEFKDIISRLDTEDLRMIRDFAAFLLHRRNAPQP